MSIYVDELEKRCDELQEQLSELMTKHSKYVPIWRKTANHHHYVFLDISLAEILPNGDSFTIVYGIPLKTKDLNAGTIRGGTKGKSLTQCKNHVERVMEKLIIRKIFLG
jgi:hypothetical protein